MEPLKRGAGKTTISTSNLLFKYNYAANPRMRHTEHPQDDLLIIESLVSFSHRLEECEPERSERASQLATDIAHAHGLTVTDALQQVESSHDTI